MRIIEALIYNSDMGRIELIDDGRLGFGFLENDELLKKEAEKTKIILSWASNVSFFRV